MALAVKESSFENLPLAGKIFMGILLLGVVSAIYYFAFHMGAVEEIEAADRRHTQLQRSMREAQERQREYLRLTQELAGREAIDRRNKRVLPENAEIAAFLQDLNRVAELTGLEMKLVEPRPEESEPHYVRIPVNLRMEGRYHQFAKFFYNMSRLERAVSMENIRLSNPQNTESDEVVLQVSTLATTYRRPTAPSGGSGAARGAAGMNAMGGMSAMGGTGGMR